MDNRDQSLEFVRPAVAALAGYVPGEQPQTGGWTKLNTNENPYPASPSVAEAIAAAVERGLQIYPDPSATEFRKAAAEIFGVDPDWILPANGSDENLTILVRTFVDPHETVAFPYPGYVLYDTLAQIQGARTEPLLLSDDWSFTAPTIARARRSKLALVPNPNSPSGTFWSDQQLQDLRPDKGILVLDGAPLAPVGPGLRRARRSESGQPPDVSRTRSAAGSRRR